MQLIPKILIFILFVNISLLSCVEQKVSPDILLIQHVLDTFVRFEEWKKNPSWDIFSGNNFICHEPRLNLSLIFKDLSTFVDTIQTPVEVISFGEKHVHEINIRVSGSSLERLSSDSTYYVLRNGSAFSQEQNIYRYAIFMVSDIYKVGSNYFFYIIYGTSSKSLEHRYFHYRFEAGKLILIKEDSAVS